MTRAIRLVKARREKTYGFGVENHKSQPEQSEATSGRREDAMVSKNANLRRCPIKLSGRGDEEKTEKTVATFQDAKNRRVGGRS